MKLILSKKLEIVFLTKDIKVTLDKKIKKVNIVLSPEFYWSRIFNIPTTSQKEAIKLLPSMFEDILPQDGYEFYAKNIEGSNFVCFAYRSKDILQALKDSNISPSVINKVYFAQNEFSSQAPFKNGNFAYINQAEKLVQIPAKLFPDFEKLSNLDCRNIELSKNNIVLTYHSNIIKTSIIYTISIFFILISILNFMLILQNSSNISKIQINKIQITQKFNLPITSIQTTAIVQRLTSTHNKQLDIREKLDYILGFKKASIDGKIVLLKLANGKLNLIYQGDNGALFVNYLQKIFTLKQQKDSKNYLHLEIKL